MKESSFQYSTKSQSSLIFDIKNFTTMKKKEIYLAKLTLNNSFEIACGSL